MNRHGSFAVAVVAVVFLMGCAKTRQEFKNEDPVDSYIVVLKKAPIQAAQAASSEKLETRQVVANMVQALADQRKIEVQKIYSVALQGGLYRMKASEAADLAQDENVAYVEKDQVVRINTTQSNATWGLDRLDQANLPLDRVYTFPDSNVQVNAYVIDTGILNNHQEFEGRAVSGADMVDHDQDSTDCNGHGTHVAGSVGAKTYGVAKKAKLIGVRVLDCNGSGTFAGVIEGIEWVAANHVKPAVANMSLGGPASQAIDDAIAASVQAGVTYVVAAGNENSNACGGSPARVPSAITVGATTNNDDRASFSNFGNCVDVFAPGQDITSTWYTGRSALNTISGTSMASPHVAGVAALYLAKNPNASPAEVAQAILAGSVAGNVRNAGAGSPNRLLNIAFLNNDSGGGDGGGSEPDVPEDPSRLKNGVSVLNLSGFQGSEHYYTFEVPPRMAELTFMLNGGRGDADLYVQFGNRPNLVSFGCRPFLFGNREMCTIIGPAPGVWHVMLHGYSAYSGAILKATVR